ncbi:MAG: hypothetical protein OEZ20_05035 [candidate division WOR-3 bacterium]|nr:hypothetical protein [candidate division WOR-3 bacterium]
MKNFLILSAIALTISLTFADTLSLPVGQVTVIRSGEVNRVRIGFDISALENARVDYAEILIPHFLTSDEIVLEGWRLLSESPSEYDTTFHARYTTEASVNLPVILDITDFMKYWVGNSNNFGVLLKRPYYQGGGFRGELQNLMNALTNARIRVFFICESE